MSEEHDKPGSSPKPAISIVGAGHWLLEHDRVGPRVLELLRGRYDDGVELLEIGTGGLALLDVLRRQSLLLVVDAGLFGGAPGEVRVMEPGLEAANGRVSSVHQLGPLEALWIAKTLFPEQMPRDVRLVLVETEGAGEDQLESACREVVRVLDALVAGWAEANAAAGENEPPAK